MADGQTHHGAPRSRTERLAPHNHGALSVRLYDTVRDVPRDHWDDLADLQPERLFFERRFLRSVQEGGAEGLTCHYALFYDGEQPVGLACFQVAEFVGQPVGPLLERAPASVSFVAQRLRLLQRAFRVRLIVCGNAFTSGEHGFAFAATVQPRRAVRALLTAVERIRQAQTGPGASAVLFKDFGPGATSHRIAGRLRDHAFTGLDTEPNMVLDVDPAWGGFPGYLESLASKYRVKVKRAFTKSAELTVRDLRDEDFDTHRETLSTLYDAVLDRADYRLGRQTPAAFRALRRELGHELVLRGFFQGDRLVGFSSGFVVDGSLETQCVGIDYDLNRELAVYPRMLVDYLQVALDRGLRRVNYGRTASEIKSTLGAEPVAVSCYVRHEQPTVNRLLPLLARSISMPAGPLRRPFKKALYVARAEREAARSGAQETFPGPLIQAT